MTSVASAANAAVLTSWKEIARYMGKGVRTVQRWELDFGLPVRRPNGSNKKAILARPSDLDAWVAMRCTVSERSREKAPALCARASLSAEMETARMLRESQRKLRAELQAELAALKQLLLSMCEPEGSLQRASGRPAWQPIDPTVELALSSQADGMDRPLLQPVPDGAPSMPASQSNLHEMLRAEETSTLRFPEAMGA
jgi:hypothetical protein